MDFKKEVSLDNFQTKKWMFDKRKLFPNLLNSKEFKHGGVKKIFSFIYWLLNDNHAQQRQQQQTKKDEARKIKIQF